VREWPLVVAVVAVDEVEGGRDMLAAEMHTFAQWC
jgi:hypothetical protein